MIAISSSSSVFGTAASSLGEFVEWATILRPFWMGIFVSVVMNATSLNAYALEKGLKKTYQQIP